MKPVNTENRQKIKKLTRIKKLKKAIEKGNFYPYISICEMAIKDFKIT